MGRERDSVDCEAEADVVVCWRGWYSCWALQGGLSAFLWAAYSGKAEAMALLLACGADLEAKSNVSPTLRD